MPNPINVVVDADFEEILPGFLENRRQDITTLQTLIPAKDYNAIQKIGHRMKGAGASYGLDFVSDVGREIEAAARAESLPDIIHQLNLLEDFLNRVDIRFVRT